MDKNKRGFVLLIVLIAIAIGMIIYYADLKAIFNLDDNDNSENLMVWEEWQKIEKEGKHKLRFYKDQPAIKEALKFQTEVTQEGQSKGLIDVVIEPNGIVKGKWSGNYIVKGIVTVVKKADFKGTIYPAKIFKDKYGADKTKVYFITKGIYEIISKNNNKSEIKSGDIYVTGWIDQDYIVKGEITLTPDSQQYEVSVWNTHKSVRKPIN